MKDTINSVDPIAYVEHSLAWVASQMEKPPATQTQEDVDRVGNYRQAYAQLSERKHESIALLRSLMRGALELSVPAAEPQFPAEANVDTLTIALEFGDLSGQREETQRYRQQYMTLVPSANGRPDLLPGPVVVKFKPVSGVRRKK